MTGETHSEHARPRPIVLSPWLVLLAGLALYALTLNHWVTLTSLPFTSRLTGWDWHPRTLLWRPAIQAPLFFLLTSPIRLLPVAWRPVALNIFTAVCAALTLALLARSVRLLPHDRTKEQRQREGGEFALITMRGAFLPAAFAVLMLSAQIGFWENAIAATGEMVDLLVFAFLIYCLLQYRITLKERWLHLLALSYGLGVANNWALIPFFPCFVVAVFWVRGLSFFQPGFILRMIGWGALGLTLYLLMPIVGAARHDAGFWDLLHSELGDQSYILRIFNSARSVVLVAWALILVPLLFAAVKWPSFEAEMSAVAHDLTRGMFRLMHLVLLAFVATMFFDLKFSPNPQRMGLPGFLTFYYLAALILGYYSGYVLIVFGRDVVYRWGQARGVLRVFNKVVYYALWIVVFAVPALLYWQNAPHIKATNSDALAQFGEAMLKSLPPKPAPDSTLVLADDPIRLDLAEATCDRLGKSGQYIFVDTQSLTHREYIDYLLARHPQLQKLLIKPDSIPPVISGPQVADLLAYLAQRMQIYYLHPSEGYYFEDVYLIPNGLGGIVKPYQNLFEQMSLPALGASDVARNQEFWKQMKKGPLASLSDLSDANSETRRIAAYYSQSIDYWGTELQKAATTGHTNQAWLVDAGSQFAEAMRLNPENILARLNLRYNNSILRGLPAPEGTLISWQAFAKSVANWLAVMNTEGPADMPELDILIGRQMAVAGNYVQAIHLFLRSEQLSPNNPSAELDIAKTEVDLGNYNDALDRLGRLHGVTNILQEVVRVEALAYTKKGDFDTAEKKLVAAQQRNPDDESFLGVMIEFYRVMGYTDLHAAAGDPAKTQKALHYFEAGLAAADKRLALLNKSTITTTEIPEAMLLKSEMLMMLKRFPEAIATLDKELQLDPDNPVPVLNRAISELQSGKIAEAKTDYVSLEKSLPSPSYVVYYGLAQVAQKQKDPAAETRYDKLYLKVAPRQTTEYTNVLLQLQKLGGH